tara:strand:+ start:3333 stop:3551 length:219 start_codon:yes stop_codon:yes gene_type:complete
MSNKIKQTKVRAPKIKKSFEVWTQLTAKEVAEGYERFWANNQISGFKDGKPIRNHRKRHKPQKWRANDIGFN